MAKSRRASRRASRRSRKTRGRKHGGRRASRRNGLFSRVYSPINQAFGFADNVVNAAQGAVRKGVVGPVRTVGSKFASRANNAVRGLLHGKRKNRKSRRNTRKNRRN